MCMLQPQFNLVGVHYAIVKLIKSINLNEGVDQVGQGHNLNLIIFFNLYLWMFSAVFYLSANKKICALNFFRFFGCC